MTIDAKGLHFQKLNELVRESAKDVTIDNCCGQRFIASGQSGKAITINGTPGNALGAYLNGANITVHGNAQDAVGDTMNDGRIVIDGNVGDAAGYAMRGGKMFVKGSAGYRAGIHMKQYKDKIPVLIIGGQAGSFLGEYQAGGMIAVLNLSKQDYCTGHFTGTGMHGGKIFLRACKTPKNLPAQVTCEKADERDIAELAPYLREYCGVFGLDINEIQREDFFVLKPNAKNPYKKLYTPN